MKTEAWFSALQAHAARYIAAGEWAVSTVWDASVIMGCSTQTARKHLKKLHDAGLVERTTGYGNGAVKTYRFSWEVKNAS